MNEVLLAAAPRLSLPPPLMATEKTETATDPPDRPPEIKWHGDGSKPTGRASLLFLHEATEELLAAAPRLSMPLPLMAIELEPD